MNQASSASPSGTPAAGTPAALSATLGARVMRAPFVRIVLGIVCVAVPVLLTMKLASLAFDKSLRVMWPQLLAAALCTAGYVFFVRRVEKRPVSELSRQGALQEAALGLALGALLLSAAIGALAALQVYGVTGQASWTVLIVPVAEMILVGMFEELLFRGVLFRIVEKSLGSWYALLISAVVFGLAHMPNADITALAIASTLSAGVLLSAAYMATRRLWLAIGLHIGWNYTQGYVFSVPVSGHPSAGWLQGHMQGPEWLTGGAYGVEGSLMAVIVTAAAAVLLLAIAHRRGHFVPR